MGAIIRIKKNGQLQIIELTKDAIINFSENDRAIPSKSTLYQFKVKGAAKYKALSKNKKVVLHCADIVHDVLGRQAEKEVDWTVEIDREKEEK